MAGVGRGDGASFNPLHCGAVVASDSHRRMAEGQGGHVSIPFIAGQWSLLWRSSSPPPRSPCFNPLHCGAVVASRGRGRGDLARARVSIPFIAGQWSLREVFRRLNKEVTRFNPLHCGAVVASRGCRGAGSAPAARFNPLHCGAVVASRAEIPSLMWEALSFQSPSLRGSGRFETPPPSALPACHVSIPFSAGQWSLPPARHRA